jgi:hypothetical protein
MILKNKPWFPAVVFFLALGVFGGYLRCSIPEAEAQTKSICVSSFGSCEEVMAKSMLRQAIALEKIAKELSRIRRR